MTAIKDEIFARMDQLSPAERKAARALLADYPSAGLASAAALARTAGCSTPTVLRLIGRLDIGSYAAFQSRLRAEVSHQLNAPVHRAQQGAVDGGQGEDGEQSLFHRSVAQRAELVERLFSTIPPGEFEHAVEVLGSKPRSVLVSGGYFSRFVAEILAMQLDQLIPGVEFAAEPLSRDIGKYLAMRKDSVAIIFDLRRYELASKQVAELARENGAKVIVITDEFLSPSAEDADVVLPVSVDGIPFDSFAALTVLVEALVEGVFHRTGTRAIERMRQWEEKVHIHRAFRASDYRDEEDDEH
ncbi:MurR/RpiR family transcriptional regulator [Leifsonia sp. L25]|uniref:MurR/RpiR family transcriptional regulator n=1 Tax=Actinomycetes TaxID=1760 RepID=UPI003D68F5E9